MRTPQPYPLYHHPEVNTLKELLAYCAERHNNNTAFSYQRRKIDVSVSHRQFKIDVEALGTYLFHQGYVNCHIAVVGENSYEWILTHFAVTCGRNVVVPIDKDLDAEGIVELLADSKSGVLVYSDTYADVVEVLQSTLSETDFINMNDISSFIVKGKELIAEGYTDYIDVEINADDLASIVYTSGTTGKAKGVMLTHGNFAIDCCSACGNVSVCGSSILLLPLHHTFGLVAAVFSEMMYGYPIYINSSLKRLQQDFLNAKPQNFFAVPLIAETLYKMIWSTAKKEGKDKSLKALIKISDALRKCGIDLRKIVFKSVRSSFGGNLDLIICGGAPLGSELVRAFDSLGITILNGYGITECSPIVAVNRNKFNVAGSVGLPLICNEVKIADDGEILVKGDNVMIGYYNDEDAKKEVFADGWYRTGDLGFFDDYGALHINGRKKNLIILSNGENISAEWIESQIQTIPYVKEVIAYGKDDAIVAEVYLDEEKADAKDRIAGDIAELNKKLPPAKNIGRVVIRNTEFPKTTTRKIKRDYRGD